jgi:hypothetical protein
MSPGFFVSCARQRRRAAQGIDGTTANKSGDRRVHVAIVYEF